MLSNEKPIHSRKEDFLNRRHFADNIANAIIEYDNNNNDSLTIGLYGKWGSGKTSIINIVLEKFENKKDIIIFNFEPWLFSNTEQLISSFFKEFAQKINHTNTNQSQKLISLGKKLEVYAGFFEPLSYISEPSIAVFGQVSSKVLSSMGKTTKNFGNAYKKNITEIKNDIEEYLNSINKKILIIIDDIDRLNNTEIKQVFQLIKALGNFPNTIYLSSMDKDVVVNALSEVQNGDGNEYLEKIINVPIEMPVISKTEVDKFLFEKLNEILKDIKEEDFDKNYWGNIFHSGYKNFFSNIRDVIRYINILRFNNDALKQNVNIIDLIAITAFQVFEPKIYEFIKQNKELLSGQISDSQYSGKRESQDKLRELLNESKVLLQKLNEESFIKILQELFIKVKETYTNTYYVGELKRCRKDSRLCSPDFFDAYFTLTLDGEMTNNEVKRIINKTSEIEFSEEINKLIKEERISIFLKRIQDFTDEYISRDKFQIILNVFIDLGDYIPNENEGVFSFGNDIQILRIIYQLLNRIEDKDERFILLKNSMKYAKNSIYIICNELSAHMQEHGEYDKESKAEELLVISNDNLQKLKILAVKKIKLWIKDNNLFEHINGLSILYFWKKVDEKSCLKYIKNMLTNQKNILKFICLFMAVGYTQSISDYTPRKTQNYNYKDIKKFIDTESLIKGVRNIKEELNENEQFCVNNFISFYEGKKQNDDF